MSRDAMNEEAQVRELLRGIASAGSPTHVERDRIQAAGWAAYERGVRGDVDDLSEGFGAARPPRSASSAGPSRGLPGVRLLAAAASIVLVAGVASFVLLRQPPADVDDARSDLPGVVLPSSSDSGTTRYTLNVGGVDLGFETDVAATFGQTGENFAWLVAAEYDAPFDGPTRYGQVLVARPTTLFDGDPEAWFESNSVDAQPVTQSDGVSVGWSLIIDDGSSRCNADLPCLPFASLGGGSEPLALAAGVVNEIRIVDVAGGDPFVVFTTTLTPRGGSSFAAAQRLQEDVAQSLRSL